MEETVRNLLIQLGEDPNREGLLRTPARVSAALKFLTHGYSMSAREILNEALFTEDYDEMVLVRDIELFSLCEHHMLPFIGKAHVAYIPNRKIVGLSKIARLVDMFARRLQVQERMTSEIASAINVLLEPQGVGVVIEAQHLCMRMRGVSKQHSSVTTSAMLGAFRKGATREEFLGLIRRD
jgi:GTP cyclohydrolase I